MLGNLRISYKLLIMIGLSVFGIAVVAAVGLSSLWANLLEDRKAKLQDVVSMARQALDLNYQASRQAGLSETMPWSAAGRCCGHSALATVTTSMP
jgi:methyl-accepting chemotaxis protein